MWKTGPLAHQGQDARDARARSPARCRATCSSPRASTATTTRSTAPRGCFALSPTRARPSRGMLADVPKFVSTPELRVDVPRSASSGSSTTRSRHFREDARRHRRRRRARAVRRRLGTDSRVEHAAGARARATRPHRRSGSPPSAARWRSGCARRACRPNVERASVSIPMRWRRWPVIALAVVAVAARRRPRGRWDRRGLSVVRLPGRAAALARARDAHDRDLRRLRSRRRGDRCSSISTWCGRASSRSCCRAASRTSRSARRCPGATSWAPPCSLARARLVARASRRTAGGCSRCCVTAYRSARPIRTWRWTSASSSTGCRSRACSTIARSRPCSSPRWS